MTDRKRILYPDAELESADWIKANRWDKEELAAEDWERYPLEGLQLLIAQPAYQAAPDWVQEIVERRLAEVED